MSYNNFKYNMQKYAFINPVTRNLVVPGNLYVDGSANIPGLQPADIAPVSSTDIIGNILSGVYVSVSGNVKANQFIGNGSFLENLTVEVPGNISADVLGNISGPKVTLTGNVAAATLTGNASRLAGVIVGFPSTGIADIRGNVYAPGNVNAANVSANSLIVYGNTFANVVTATGNVYATYFSGNGFFLTDVTQTFPSAAVIDIVGNVSAPGNVDTLQLTTGNIVAGNVIANSMVIAGNISALYFSGNASNVTGIVPRTLDTEIFGNVFATGNVSASYLIGNGTAVTLGGYTIVPRGTVANQTARLALPDALPGSIVFQTDANVTYMLLGTPASLVSNWLQFTGANFPVTSVMGRTGNVLLLSNVDVKTIGGANIAAPGSLTSANIDIIGNIAGQFLAANVIVSGGMTTNVLRANTMTVAGNVIANYLVGNGMLLEAVQLTIPRTANIDITGNVLAPANVDTQSIITTVVRAGNVSVNGQVNVVGNVSAAYFVGNGSTMTGIPASGTQPIGIVGNVSAPGNVNASNVTTDNIQIGNSIALGQVNVLGNVVTDGFFTGSGSRLTNVPAIVTGTQAMNISGNVSASGNVDASNVLTSVLRAPNVIVTGQVNSSGGNVSSLGFFIGSGAQLTGVTATLGGTQSLDIIGNVVASGNVDATNVSTRLLRVTGNVNVRGQVNVTGNVIALNFFGSGAGLTGVTATATGNQSINIVGNVVASANVDASNVSANILRVLGNIVVGGQVNVIGNVTSNRLIGNGIFLEGIIATGNLNVDITGNVAAVGNVNTQNIITSLLQTSNCVITGQANVIGNVVAGSFAGDGSLLQGIILGAGGSPLPSFVPPSTGFTSDVANTIVYSNTVGWTIQLQQYQPTNIGITTYNMPVNPDAPFVNLPSTVTQRLNTPWSFSNGVWSGNVNVFSTTTFSSQPVSMGYNSGYGVLGGNSSVTNGVGIPMVSTNGLINITGSSGWKGDVWPNPATGSLWTFFLPSSTTTVLGQTFPAGQIYFLEMSKNMNYIISWHQVSSTVFGTGSLTTTGAITTHYIVSATEVYLLFSFTSSDMNSQIYDTVCIPGLRAFTPTFMARVNPTARTCQWATYLQAYNGASFNGTNAITVNPQRTILYLQSILNTGGNNPLTIGVGNSTGANTVVFPIPTFASIRIGIGMAFFPGNGIYIPNTMSGVYNTTAYDDRFNLRLTLNSDIWSADGQVAYTCWSSSGSQPMVLGTWNAASNTFTARSTISPQQVTGTGGFTSQPFIYRLPVGNVNSTWTGATITTTRDTSDTNGRQPQVTSITPTNNGNVFIFAISGASNTAVTATSTWGTASTSVASGVLYSPPQIFSFQDTNGTFSNYGATSGTSTATLDRRFGQPNSWLGIASIKTPGSNTSIRVMSTTNFPDLTLYGVAASNLNSANTTVVPVVFDINSSLTVSNFRGQLPVTVGNSAASSPLLTSPTIYLGPAADNNYTILGMNSFGAGKIGNV
ncbi:Chlorovirus glycoprotein repeat domain-containing protein [Paramecium bursaria Chlorella virus CVR-1]|uniref:Chlorovirus glycoprotein repeat domain-containing protein n=1 Tax=Paramecium bursaria Chlorella virus CVA-1 TaxID=42683 RepID=M1HJM0_9PHYC|nr:Chlorovirus glycoprotein repeat domain-containing protein [Paramecium bursaria Chlorella virus CVA-1]AGE50379.1 Chlorovirus glycoprotein repeat domain-containing protein [Paramecium bursaria Chlorella virus CVA-1]AGE52055.1 Chlorovirus glycoprotein repeat domain-containing protein [Paramecium bursaria Chlorella virus CVR-1]